MARTRKSDPGRVDALHYAATPRQRHAKPLVYAYLLLGLAGGFPGWPPALVQARQANGNERPAQAEVAPCSACQSLSVTAAQIPLLPERLAGARVFLRLFPGATGAEWPPALEELRRRGATTGLHVVGVPADEDPVLAAVANTLIVEVDAGDADRLAFDLKRALSLVRGRHPDESLLIAASSDVTAALRERGMAPYADGFVARPAEIGSPEDLLTPGARIWRLPADAAAARAVAAAAVDLQAWLPEGLVPVSERPLRCGADRRLPALLNPRTLDLIAVSRACPASAVVTSDVPGASAERLEVGGASVFRVRVSGADRFAEGVDVSAARALTIDEIVARHQAAAARQAAEIVTSVATGSLTLTFEAPGFVAPITITSRTTIFEDKRRRAEGGEGQTDLQQAEIRVNGVRFTARDGVPRLPIIEPERAAAPPLAITLSDVYRYRLVGREPIDGRDSYVVAFVPRDRRASLYEGRAWIDAATFGMARVAAAQTGLRGPITASEQTDDYTIEAPARWRLARSDVRQTYEGAAVRTPIHRLLVIERDEVNPPDFESRRAAAYASPDVMKM